jgi:hypothetical protein
MTDNEICQLVNQAFAGLPRPEHFTDFEHCSECKEHDDLLRSRTLDTLAIDDVSNPCWQPVCFLNPEGWLYFFPAFVRLTFANPQDSFLGQFLFFLTDAIAEHFAAFSHSQKATVRAFLHHVRESHQKLVCNHASEKELAEAIIAWEHTA